MANQTLFAQTWVLVRSEHFNSNQTLSDQVAFGDRDWLTTRIRNNGSIVVSDGRANIATPDFPDSAMIRIVESLPDEYKLRLRIGDVHYSTTEYEEEDFLDPDFKYRWADPNYSDDYSENGLYWLTLTDRLIEPDSGEDWWHRYRKIVMDSDDHLNVPLPLYMVYMNPDLDRSQGNWIYGMSGLLRCWHDSEWHTSGWLVGFNYEIDENYEVEIEKFAGYFKMRSYDSVGTIIEDTDWVDLNLIYAMRDIDTAPEYAYFGEPHIDSYEGSAWIDDIQLWIINSSPVIETIEDKNVIYDEPLSFTVNASDSTFLDSFTLSVSILPDGATFNDSTGLFAWTPTQAQEGDHHITFTATDEHGASDNESLTISVSETVVVQPTPTPTASTNPTDSTISATGGCGRIENTKNSLIFIFLAFSALILLALKKDLTSIPRRR